MLAQGLSPIFGFAGPTARYYIMLLVLVANPVARIANHAAKGTTDGHLKDEILFQFSLRHVKIHYG